MSGVVPNAEPHLGGNEWKYLKECLDTNWLATGPFVERFEREIAAYVGAPYGVATATGTAALHVALLVAGVEPGDEVLCPALTFIATAGAIRYCGAHPVILDCEERSWGLDPQKLADFLERECDVRDGRVIDRDTGRVVRAVLPVHLYGHPVDLDPILALAQRYPLAVVEDAAEALGARYRGRRVGAHGRIGCLSFNGNKIITTGGGGLVLTHDEALAQRVRALTQQARRPGPEWVHDEIGFNYRLSNLQAAVGVAQIEQLDRFIEAKRETASVYGAALARLGGVTPLAERPDSFATFWLYSATFAPARYGDTRALIATANREGLQFRPLFYPLHRQPVLAGERVWHVEVADRLWACGVSLPSSVGITADERARVIAFLAGAAK